MHENSPISGADPAGRSCPPWCATGHAVDLGEEDWVHLGEPLPVTEGAAARLCMSVEPGSGTVDGPYVLVGGVEYTLDEAEVLGARLIAMAGSGRLVTAVVVTAAAPP